MSWWNYRIGTKMYSYKKNFGKTNSELANQSDERLFSVIEVYYDSQGVPTGYSDTSVKDWDSYKDLEETYKLMAKAFQKPVLDLDNWPEEWKE